MSFSKEEYKQRLLKVQSLMREKKIDLIISHDTNNMNYLTGYDAWSFYYAQCVLVHVDSKEPICFVRDQDAGGAYIKTYLNKDNIIVYDESYIHTWPKHPYDYLTKVIKEKKWDKLSIGVEMDAHYFTAFCYEKIKKSSSCNARKRDWTFNFYGTEEFGGEYSSIATLLPTGKGTSASHLTATQDKFIEGEATIIELSGVYKRYHAPMARTILLGKPDQLKIDTMNKTIEALQAGINATKPGNTANDVAQAFWKILDKYGIEKKSRTGYSIGIGYPPDWGEHTLNIYKGDMTVLEPNVCFHMIAVMQFGDWGVEASEAIRVTDKGCELFCNFPKELHIKNY